METEINQSIEDINKTSQAIGAQRGINLQQLSPLSLSTENAADEVAQADKKMKDLAGKPKTEEEDVTDKDLEKLLGEDEEVTAEELVLSEQEKELKGLRSELDSYQISDAELISQVNTISSRWDVRIREMEDVNLRREKALETTGYRLGGQYTGGVRGGVFGGVITAEERAGIARIGELESLKQAEISAARQAQADRKWDIYVEKVNAAEKAVAEQRKKVVELNKADKERRKKVMEDHEKVSRQMAIADLFSQGITDPSEILDFINFTEQGEQVGDIDLEEIENTLKIISPEDKLSGVTATYKTYKNMQKTGEIPKKWSYFDFEAAISNSRRKPEEEEDEGGLVPNAPEWEEYLNAAEQVARQTFTPEVREELRQQYLDEYSISDLSDFNDTQKLKLEQAGLLNATRQEQLDHLYKKKEDEDDIESMSDEDFIKALRGEEPDS